MLSLGDIQTQSVYNCQKNQKQAVARPEYGTSDEETQFVVKTYSLQPESNHVGVSNWIGQPEKTQANSSKVSNLTFEHFRYTGSKVSKNPAKRNNKNENYGR